MNSSVETLEGNKVKVSVSIDEAEFDRSIDQAFKKIAREVRLPGFRAGKAPRRVLEARIGLQPAREQALQDAIPQYLAQAVREHDVDIIATPEVEVTSGTEEGPVAFDATCEVRPEITVPGYGGLRVELANPTATDDEVQEAIAGELKRHGELVDVERPAARGDYVTLDLVGTRDGEPVTGLTTEDWSYEIGQGWVADDFDDQLIGASAGDELSFTTTPKGTSEPADFAITVSRVQELVPPELTDEWVADNHADVDTVEAWTANIRDNISANKAAQMRRDLIGKVTAALTSLTDIETPDALVDSDLRNRVDATVRQFQAQGVNMDQFLAATGQDGTAFVESLRGQSVNTIKTDLALRAVAAAEELTVDRRRPRQRVPAHRPAGEPEAQPGAQGLREQRPGAQPRGPDPQGQGARLAAAPRRVRRRDRRDPAARPRARPRPRRRRQPPARRRRSDDDIDPDDDTQTDDDAPAVAADSTDTPTTGESADTEA